MTDVTKLTGDTLIAADKVNGTNVYGLDGKKLGEVEDIMLDKISGHVAYAVLSFGGFMGMGEKQYPLPWSQLKYDTRLGGYVVDITKETLKNAPSIEATSDFTWTADYGRGIDKYYKTPSMWM